MEYNIVSINESCEIVERLKHALLTKRITKLQYQVYTELLKIPQGKVTTYINMAKAVKCNSARAIGQALRKNPFAPEVPCHRVVKSDMTLGGFSGSEANQTVRKKLKLLLQEGIKITEIKDDQCSHAKINKECVWIFTTNGYFK